MARRWQPPPMDEDKNKITVDERVVRKMLEVNPDLRKGRTTFQVKKALEQGEPVVGSSASVESSAGKEASRPAGHELAETVDFFVSGKADRLSAKLADIDARRRSLEAEEQRARAEMGEQMVSFVALLDEAAVGAHGKVALSRHADFLAQVGLTPAALMDRARNK